MHFAKTLPLYLTAASTGATFGGVAMSVMTNHALPKVSQIFLQEAASLCAAAEYGVVGAGIGLIGGMLWSAKKYKSTIAEADTAIEGFFASFAAVQYHSVQAIKISALLGMAVGAAASMTTSLPNVESMTIHDDRQSFAALAPQVQKPVQVKIAMLG